MIDVGRSTSYEADGLLEDERLVPGASLGNVHGADRRVQVLLWAMLALAGPRTPRSSSITPVSGN